MLNGSVTVGTDQSAAQAFTECEGSSDLKTRVIVSGTEESDFLRHECLCDARCLEEKPQPSGSLVMETFELALLL